MDTTSVQCSDDSHSSFHVTLSLASHNVATVLRVCCMYVFKTSVFLMYDVVFFVHLYHSMKNELNIVLMYNMLTFNYQ